MPADMKRYPSNWTEIVAQVRARSGGRCECVGECGLHHDRRCVEVDGGQGRWMKGRVILTTAHLWQGPCRDCHERGEKCGHVDHLKHMCQRCHLRYDVDHHKANAAKTRDQKRGQLRMFSLLLLLICSCAESIEPVSIECQEDVRTGLLRLAVRQRDVAMQRIEDIKALCRQYWGDPEAMAIERAANAPLPEVPE